MFQASLSAEETRSQEGRLEGGYDTMEAVDKREACNWREAVISFSHSLQGRY